MNYKIGIDVGGTFTDFLLTRSDGMSKVYKVLSTPKDPSIATMQGISDMAQDEGLDLGVFLKAVDVIVHGTTVTTNAVLTYRGAKTGLLTTSGVRDALEMRRGIREEQYNNRYTNVAPLVPRYLRLPVRGRLDYSGAEVTPLSEEDLRSHCASMKSEGVEAVAVCFMNSFGDSSHEERAAAAVKEILPEAYLAVSTQVLPAIRFYDRVSTTVLTAYVGPILKRYLASLVKKLDDAGFPNVLLIMQSNGGVVSPAIAMDHAATTLLSGPAGGPVAGIVYAGIQHYRDSITMDMGGTSFDCALIKDAKPFTTTAGEINRLRLALPMLNVVTIGAGGGSIGWIDEGGLLRMGPQSASSDPGPVSYGLGGEEPTCTDADLVLGYLDPDFFAGGRMPLHLDKAKKAIEEKIAKPLGYDLYEAAAGMYRVINVNMAAAVREVAVQHGQDPRDFPLVVAGGAGPNHACMIALELENPVLIVPRESSIFCAAGMLMSDLKHNFVRTYAVNLKDADPQVFGRLFEEMRQEGKRLLVSEGIKESEIEYRYSLDLRYLKQYHEVGVPVSAQEVDGFDIASMAARFHPAHNALYGYSLEEQGTPIELINMRLECVGMTEKPRFQTHEYAGEDPGKAYKRQRSAYLPLAREFRDIPIFDGLALEFGNRIEGPAIVEQVNTTTFVAPEFNVLTDRYGSFTMYLKELEEEVKRRILS
ncbi:MAG: hydantoinase/oxoprolinase family protein [Thermodesulfobacteriota bacterium]